MTIIDANYDALLGTMTRHGRGFLAMHGALAACRLADTLLRIGMLNWCFLRLVDMPVTFPPGPCCAFVAGEIMLQTFIAILDTASRTGGERFDARCMDAAVRAVHAADPKRRGEARLSDKLSDYRFNMSYIGSVSRNATHMITIVTFVCSMIVYLAVLGWLGFRAVAAHPAVGGAAGVIAVGTLAWLTVASRCGSSGDGAENFGDILRTERRRMYYLFDIVHRYPVHAVIDSFHAGGFIKRRYRELNDRGLGENLEYLHGVYAGQRRLLVQQIILFAVIIGMLAVAAAGDPSLLALFPMVVGVGMQAMDAGGRAMDAVLMVRRVSPYLGNVVDMLSTDGAWEAKDHPQDVPPMDSIGFDHVWFSYDGGDDYALRDVNLHLDLDGSITAIVGVNGAGKSTLLALIAALQRPTRGHVLIDGTDLAERIDAGSMNFDSYMGAVGVLPQAHHLFAATVRENVLSGVRGRRTAGLPGGRTTDERTLGEPMTGIRDDPAKRRADDPALVERLLRDLGADEGLMQRLDRHVESLEPDNMTISGGESQRVAIARMLAVPGRRLYLFDEPTAVFDPSAQTAFFRNLRTLVHGVTAVVVTHDVASCAFADRVIVIEDGTIAEQGTYADLLAAGGRFAELAAAQRRNRTIRG